MAQIYDESGGGILDEGGNAIYDEFGNVTPNLVKPLTQWIPESGIGYALNQLGVYLETNLGQLLVTNSGQNIIPNPYYVVGKYPTAWTATPHA